MTSSSSAIASTPPRVYQKVLVSTGIMYSLIIPRRPSCSLIPPKARRQAVPVGGATVAALPPAFGSPEGTDPGSPATGSLPLMSVSSSKDEDGVVARGIRHGLAALAPQLLLCSCRQRTDACIILLGSGCGKGRQPASDALPGCAADGTSDWAPQRSSSAGACSALRWAAMRRPAPTAAPAQGPFAGVGEAAGLFRGWWARCGPAGRWRRIPGSAAASPPARARDQAAAPGLPASGAATPRRSVWWPSWRRAPQAGGRPRLL